MEWNWLFNVTINDISVIYVTAHRCAGGLKKKLDLRSGSQRHRHFVGFFNVPVQAPHGTTLFIRWFRHTAPFSRLLRSRWGYGGHILDFLTPRALRGIVINSTSETWLCFNLPIVYQIWWPYGNRSWLAIKRFWVRVLVWVRIFHFVILTSMERRFNIYSIISTYL